ncbi:Imm63 family immunity protein [Herbaspirillum sp. NPDC101397]|jgi:hypothetical protein|uniref:Imm63 family immunity protein n=1 Tax=Herbaspirillum sp. NPDC101397 TaxID=3364006 RepID=UPI00383A868A
MTNEFRDLQGRYTQLCQLLAPYRPRYRNQNKIQTHRQDDGSPHIEIVDGFYHYVVTERGTEYERKIAADEDELLYWLLSDVTTAISVEIEVQNRVLGQDSRRQWFAKNVELLSRLNEKWAERKKSEYTQVLAEHPFRDEA